LPKSLSPLAPEAAESIPRYRAIEAVFSQFDFYENNAIGTISLYDEVAIGLVEAALDIETALEIEQLLIAD